CLVHVSRNISHHVRVHDRKAVLNDFKLIHQATNKRMAEHSLANFVDHWRKRYPKVTQALLKNQKLLVFFNFPPAIRSSIYSTNLIESFNKKFKRQTKKREQFPNEESLERTLMTVILDYNDKFGRRTHKGFNLVQDTLKSMF
ncbi:transposase, partial [Pediococcus parvulus]|uniref:transposase n=3 Tax=Pediococcus TaxID=1253 RepID=UPI0021A3B0C0